MNKQKSAQSASLLDGLLATPTKSPTSLLDGLLPDRKPRAVAKPKWVITSITHIYAEQHCTNCGEVELSLTPRVFLTETNHTLNATRSTTHPDHIPEDFATLPLHTETVRVADNPFCRECFEELTPENLRLALCRQVETEAAKRQRKNNDTAAFIAKVDAMRDAKPTKPSIEG